MTDFCIAAVSSVSCPDYLTQWIACVIGIILVGVGVSFEVTAGVVTLAGEGFVLAVCKVAPIPFPKMKITFDVTLVLISTVLSLVFLGSLQGVREGTIAAALCVGLVAKKVNVPMKHLEEKYLMGEETDADRKKA